MSLSQSADAPLLLHIIGTLASPTSDSPTRTVIKVGARLFLSSCYPVNYFRAFSPKVIFKERQRPASYKLVSSEHWQLVNGIMSANGAITQSRSCEGAG